MKYPAELRRDSELYNLKKDNVALREELADVKSEKFSLECSFGTLKTKFKTLRSRDDTRSAEDEVREEIFKKEGFKRLVVTNPTEYDVRQVDMYRVRYVYMWVKEPEQPKPKPKKRWWW